MDLSRLTDKPQPRRVQGLILGHDTWFYNHMYRDDTWGMEVAMRSRIESSGGVIVRMVARSRSL